MSENRAFCAKRSKDRQSQAADLDRHKRGYMKWRRLYAAASGVNSALRIQSETRHLTPET